MREIVLILHDIRSTHNVGSLLRTAEGIGVQTVFFTGYTPYPSQPNDTRLPHIHQKLTQQIHKTALGAETQQPWQRQEDIYKVLDELTQQGYTLLALEQGADSVPLHTYQPPEKVAILLGREVEGVDEKLLKRMTALIEIPMFGQKESFNVVQAAAMCLYKLRFYD